jgi:hypothetical protein
MEITRYDSGCKEEWDRFVRASKNGTFILLRDYMDYHRDRFMDHSLMIRDQSGRLLALFPANEDGITLVSHGGLTYGGVVSDFSMTTPTMLELFAVLLEYFKRSGKARVLYKSIPHVYHVAPAEEDRYALFRYGARLYRRDVLSVVSNSAKLPLRGMRERWAAKARKRGLCVVASEDFAAFWPLLEENLSRKYNVRPVHTREEICLLHTRFPESIRLHLCVENGEALAGAVIFDTPQVAHAQYISVGSRGRTVGALDLLFVELIQGTYSSRPYFDFGSSCTDDGRTLNIGLVEQKEGFGARASVQDFYELMTA